MRPHRWLRRSQRGQALVEFALVLPLLIVVLVGIFDFGRAIYYYTTANNAAREAGRLAIVDQTLGHIQALAAQRAVALGIDPATVQVEYRNQDTPDAANSCGSAPGQPGITSCIAVVRVPYTYTAATPIISGLVGPIDIVGEARFPVAFSCLEPVPNAKCPIGD